MCRSVYEQFHRTSTAFSIARRLSENSSFHQLCVKNGLKILIYTRKLRFSTISCLDLKKTEFSDSLLGGCPRMQIFSKTRQNLAKKRSLLVSMSILSQILTQFWRKDAFSDSLLGGCPKIKFVKFTAQYIALYYLIIHRML